MLVLFTRRMKVLGASVGSLVVWLGSVGLAVSGWPPRVSAHELSLSGFTTLHAATEEQGAWEDDRLVARAHLGFEWTPSGPVSLHLNLQARTDDEGSQSGAIGLSEAYVEANFVSYRSRVRLRGGAFFLPTSLENVDALWENPYALSSSALNTWLGEELRPVGLDLTYYRSGAMLGATVYRGNETLGALPAGRGWVIGDRWTLLGEKAPVDDEVFTSLTAENDGRLGWSARVGWGGQHWEAKYTRFDNRSDGLRYGDLRNWRTRFDIVGIGYASGPWTFAAESGWGPTFLVVRGRRITSDIAASYLLVARRLGAHRASLRLDHWDDGDFDDEALTFAFLADLAGSLRLGGELTAAGDDLQLQVQLRYALSLR